MGDPLPSAGGENTHTKRLVENLRDRRCSGALPSWESRVDEEDYGDEWEEVGSASCRHRDDDCVGVLESIFFFGQLRCSRN